MITKVLKETTRIAGLAVSNNPHYALTVLYDKLLRTLDKMPDTAAYKQYTKPVIENRLKLVNTIKCPVELEKQINSGQIEEVIKEAEYELSLSRKMLNWKPWEPLVSEAPPNQWTWPVSAKH